MAVGDLPPMEPKEEEEEAQAPLWMVTMSDMNTLLMTFFVILFSLLVVERNKYLRLSTQAQPKGLPDRSPEEGIIDAEKNDSRIFSGWEPGRSKRPAKLEIMHENEMVEVRVVSVRPQGTIITVGGELGSFPEGSWRLQKNHLVILNEILKWMGPQRHRIRIRGFTAGNLEDSVVRDGTKIRPYAREDWEAEDYRDRADHWLLASLRAHSVREALVRGMNGRMIDVSRLEVQVDAYNEPVADNVIRRDRNKNRRVEIVVLPPK